MSDGYLVSLLFNRKPKVAQPEVAGIHGRSSWRSTAHDLGLSATGLPVDGCRHIQSESGPWGDYLSSEIGSQISERLQSCLLGDHASVEPYRTSMEIESQCSEERCSQGSSPTSGLECRSLRTHRSLFDDASQRTAWGENMTAWHQGARMHGSLTENRLTPRQIGGSQRFANSFPHRCITSPSFHSTCSHGEAYSPGHSVVAASIRSTKSRDCVGCSTSISPIVSRSAVSSGIHISSSINTSLTPANPILGPCCDGVSCHPEEAEVDGMVSPDGGSRQCDSASNDSMLETGEGRDSTETAGGGSGPSLGSALSALLSGRGGRTLIPGKYAPRHLAAAAVAMPVKIARRFRAVQQQPVIEEEPECIPVGDGSRSASFSARSSFDSRPTQQGPVDNHHQLDLSVPPRFPGKSQTYHRKGTGFGTIPCIQGALAVREVPVNVARGAYRASTARRREPYKGRAEHPVTLSRPSNRKASSRRNGMNGTKVIGHWAFLDAVDPAPVRGHHFGLHNPVSGAAPRPDQGITAVSPLRTDNGFAASSGSQCSRWMCQNSGLVLGCGDPEQDSELSKGGLEQYLKIGCSIRRMARAFRNVATRFTEPHGIDSDCSESKAVGSLPGRSLSMQGPIPSSPATEAQGSRIGLPDSPATDTSCKSRIPSPGLGDVFTPDGLTHSLNLGDCTCVAASWMEILSFVQAILNLQLRRKRARYLAVAAYRQRKHHLVPTAITLDFSEVSTKASSLCTRVSNDTSHGTVPTASSPYVSARDDMRDGCGGLDGCPNHSRSLRSGFDAPTSSAYWIVFVALWIEHRMHAVAKQLKDPSLIQRFCCCHVFLPSGMTSTSRQPKRDPNELYFEERHHHASVTPSVSDDGPSRNGSRHRPPDRKSGSFHACSQSDSAYCSSNHDEDNRSRSAYDVEVALPETVDSLEDTPSETANWGPQIDSIRRFLILCFSAWSWIEDECIRTGNLVSILQHIWWCADMQINLGLASIAKARLRNVPQNRAKQQTGPPSEIEGLDSHTFAARKPTNVAPILGRVGRLREAVTAGSRYRLFAQYFGQQHEQHQQQVLPSDSDMPCSVDSDHAPQVAVDYYGEYLALAPSCSTEDFEAQVFGLMQSLGFQLHARPEVMIALSARWRACLKCEDCCPAG